MRPVRQRLQCAPDFLLADAERLRNARLHHQLAVGAPALACALPPPQQQLDRFFIEAGAIFRQLPPTGVQRRHQGEQQGPRSQIGQVGPLPERGLQAPRPTACGRRVPAHERPDRVIPTGDKAGHLFLGERGERQGAELRQLPAAVRVGVWAGRDKYARRGIGQGCRERTHGLQQHLAAAVRLRHLVQAVEQEEAAFGQQTLLQMGQQLRGRSLSLVDGNVTAQRVPQHRGRASLGLGRDAARSHVAQHEPHRQQALPGGRQGWIVRAEQVGADSPFQKSACFPARNKKSNGSGHNYTKPEIVVEVVRYAPVAGRAARVPINSVPTTPTQ
ncbi:MAG: hypothetical protein ACM30E_00835 [Nitrososphaerales archaeon]